ncbi:MAG: hypothetical protein GX804_11260 [Lentisphaerae bacterium]|jgi:hypothetical protein|nr:hypothetical protein [Lentisphaerota bacterium]
MLFVSLDDHDLKLKSIFRWPVLPFICNTGKHLIGVASLQKFDSMITALNLPSDDVLAGVDADAAGWTYFVKDHFLSPFTSKRRWTKKEVVEMYNGSTAAKKLNQQYSIKSLSAKRFDRIITEIVELIQSAEEVKE